MDISTCVRNIKSGRLKGFHRAPGAGLRSSVGRVDGLVLAGLRLASPFVAPRARLGAFRWALGFALRCTARKAGGPSVGAWLRRPALRAGSLRFSLREGGCDHSASALNAPMHRAFSPVRPAAGLPLAPLRCSRLRRRAHRRAPSLAKWWCWRACRGRYVRRMKVGSTAKGRAAAAPVSSADATTRGSSFSAHATAASMQGWEGGRRGASGARASQWSGGKSAALRRTGENALCTGAFSGRAE